MNYIFLTSMLVHDFIHADLHTGNWKITFNPMRIILYDCGIICKTGDLEFNKQFMRVLFSGNYLDLLDFLNASLQSIVQNTLITRQAATVSAGITQDRSLTAGDAGTGVFVNNLMTDFYAIINLTTGTIGITVTSSNNDYTGYSEALLSAQTSLSDSKANLKSAVTKSSKYEPTLNETFADFASHYSTAVLPARAYQPKDKALVEGAVKISYTRINAKLRNQHYLSLETLNIDIQEKTLDHNKTPLTGKKYSRFEQYDEVERHALQPLPLLRYEFKKQAYVTVMKNGHVSLADDRH
jgi:hypothetical protein